MRQQGLSGGIQSSLHASVGWCRGRSKNHPRLLLVTWELGNIATVLCLTVTRETRYQA